MGMSRNVLFRILAAAVAVMAGLLAAELVLRLVPRRTVASTIVAERPRSFDIATPDFRDGRPRMRKRENTFRVVVLGDSYTWGSGVYAGDAYPQRLERRMSSILTTLRAEVISWSQPGWNTREAWQALEPRLDVLAPDLVVIGYCLNDAESSSRKEREAVRRDYEIDAWRKPEKSRRGLERRSVLASRVLDAWRNVRSRRKLDDYYHGLYQGSGWIEARATFREMRDRLEARGIRLLIVIHPIFDSQLDHRYRYRDIHETVVREAQELEIPVLDLLGHYEGIDARRLAVVPFTDAHPSELAHRIAADRILDFVLVKGWLGGDPGAVEARRQAREKWRKIRRAERRAGERL
jgi:lysophospholipase L1-like esterase